MAIGRIPMKEFLIRRGVQFQQMKKECPWCDNEIESLKHLFFKCKFVEGFWKKIINWWEIRWSLMGNFKDLYKI